MGSMWNESQKRKSNVSSCSSSGRIGDVGSLSSSKNAARQAPGAMLAHLRSHRCVKPNFVFQRALHSRFQTLSSFTACMRRLDVSASRNNGSMFICLVTLRFLAHSEKKTPSQTSAMQCSAAAKTGASSSASKQTCLTISSAKSLLPKT